MNALKKAIPPPIRAIGWRWRWVAGTPAYREAPLRCAAKLALWTTRELLTDELSFTAPDGMKFVCAANNSVGLTSYIANHSEPALDAVIRAHLRPGDTFLDAGANIGTWSARAARCVGPTGRVLSVEAHPATFDYLRRNIALNALTNITALNAAVGAEEGTVRMVYMPDNPGESHIGEGGGTVEVKLRPLDALCVEHGIATADYLKIDVEGFELPVLRGAAGIIAASPRIIVQTEMVPRHAARYGFRLEDITAFARSLGLSPHRPLNGGLDPLTDAAIARNTDVLWARR